MPSEITADMFDQLRADDDGMIFSEAQAVAREQLWKRFVEATDSGADAA